MTDSTFVTLSPLGKKNPYISEYQNDLLFAIPRTLHRNEIGVPPALPFKGCDIWNAFELSWLNPKGKPVVALGEFIFPCESPRLIESKSFKLYLNSFNNTKFASVPDVVATLERDLSNASGAEVAVKMIPVKEYSATPINGFPGIYLDNLDIECNVYHIDPSFLQVEENNFVTEELYSDLLKSNCLITGQPDWASISITYSGNKLKHDGLLKYLVSFRNHNEFHEQCVERIFMDILTYCAPKQLTVYARYTRRGGLDINPFRSTEIISAPGNRPIPRQ